jgi:lipid A ethanolaminephosphotransferase
VVNAYDNTLLYTDHFLASTIHWLEQQKSHATPAMLYVSDHGESLGENNLYLHGLPYAVAPQTQTRVPLITWVSPGFEAWRGISTACLRQGRDRALSHDHLFHSVLGLMGVATEVYAREWDLFAACERP